MIPKPHERTRTLGVAVYWIRSGEYGGVTKVKSYKEAEAEVLKCVKLGYGVEGRDEIRIIETSKRIWKFNVAKKKDVGTLIPAVTED